MATTESKLLTAEEFFRLPDQGQPVELVRGRVVRMNVPGGRHGELSAEITFQLKLFIEQNELGRVVANDSGFLTERNPDSVRGPDVAYYSYSRMGKEQATPVSYFQVPPDIAFEVLSPNDSPKHVLAKVSEYLIAGVLIVCVVDPERKRAVLYYPDRPEESFGKDAELSFGELLPGFLLPLAKLWK